MSHNWRREEAGSPVNTFCSDQGTGLIRGVGMETSEQIPESSGRLTDTIWGPFLLGG